MSEMSEICIILAVWKNINTYSVNKLFIILNYFKLFII